MKIIVLVLSCQLIGCAAVPQEPARIMVVDNIEYVESLVMNTSYSETRTRRQARYLTNLHPSEVKKNGSAKKSFYIIGAASMTIGVAAGVVAGVYFVRTKQAEFRGDSYRNIAESKRITKTVGIGSLSFLGAGVLSYFISALVD